MSQGVPLRTDYTADDLRRLSRTSNDSKQTRRLLALALIYDGATRLCAANHAHFDRQSIRDWVLQKHLQTPSDFILIEPTPEQSKRTGR